jgi:hypothetical protein
MTGVGVNVAVLLMTRFGVAVPLFVTVQLTTSAAWMVKLIGSVLSVATLVPDGLVFVQTTVWA